MDKENVKALSHATDEDVRFAQDISAKIVTTQSAELDKIIAEIKQNIIEVPNTALDETIEKYMLRLVITLYALNSQIDSFSFYEAVSDAKAKLAYNDKYAKSQMQASIDNKKLTKDDHQQYAENNTIDEKMLNLIYSKSVRTLKDKVDGGYEMLDVLKRILRHHEQENFYDKQNKSILG